MVLVRTGRAQGVSSHRPREAYAGWRLCQEDGSVARWYINLQDPFRIHDQCVDTLDHELDVVVTPDGQHWHIKDAERVDVSARQGRFGWDT
jgi:protein associated with RNAse G/E